MGKRETKQEARILCHKEANDGEIKIIKIFQKK